MTTTNGPVTSDARERGRALSIAHVASEMVPLVKVGGLGDVVSALSFEQARRGHAVVVAIPAYRTLELPAGWTREPLGGCEVPWGMGREPARFERCRGRSDEPAVLLVHHAGERRFFGRAGVYDDPANGQGYSDNGERFLFFARAAVEGLKLLDLSFDVVHAHDQQAAWVPCFLRTHEAEHAGFSETVTIFTIHNLGYQGIHDAWVLGLAGFGRELFYPSGPFEYWGRVNSMKVGIAFADLISTVSPRYAQEIRESGEFGFGLEGVLERRAKDLRGILNGIDDTYWNPATDSYLTHHFDVERMDGKRLERAALIERCQFPARPDWPVVGMVTRLVEQKGLDLIEQARGELLKLETRFVVLGSGQPRYEELLRRLATDHPGRFAYRSGYDEPLAHQIEAGSDLFLMPSRYEPCGLNQMYSLRYGTPPLVREVGGLADTVQEFNSLTREGTGFLFEGFEAAEMVAALKKALAIHRQPELWRTLQRNGMRQDFSWRRSADAYDQLYAEGRERLLRLGPQTLEAARASVAFSG
jgi:starch synthase